MPARLLTLFVLMALPLSLPASDDEVSFDRQIRPIFAEHCLECHGPDSSKREAELRLDVEQSAKESVITSGKPRDSELFQRLTASDPDLRMPPAHTGKKLTSQQVELIRKWIASGAKYERHWAFQRIRSPIPPNVEARTDIDRFIAARLKKNGLKLSRRVTRQKLIRRATFDLIGLPPTWSEVVAFENDDSPKAFEKVIDRLLSSPRYGERGGRHWLDIARYADTEGGAAIGFTRFPFSYTYRDYVISAFNSDTPYDRFVKEQLAADQLGLADNDPALAGLGFLTVGMQFRNPHDTIDDQIDVVTRGLLALTVACARCHDHKYDAVPTTDYYSLYATLASSSAPDLLPLAGTPDVTPAYEAYQRQLRKLQIQRDDMGREQSEVMRGRLRMQVGLYLREIAKGTPEQDLASQFLSYRTDDLRPLVINRWRDYLAKLPENDGVFGLWIQSSKAKGEAFQAECLRLIGIMKNENGDPAKFAPEEKVGSNEPRWNPRVLNAVETKKPKSLIELADIYGKLLADVQQEWLKALVQTSLEAQAGATVVPDQSPKHKDVNSPINRQLRRHLYAPGTPIAMPDELAVTLLNRPVRDNLRGRGTAIRNLDLTSPGAPPRSMALREKMKPDQFHVFRRGSPIDRGEVVQARFLTALSLKKSKPFGDGKRRLGLAEAIVDPGNPLTRRVIVNWVWLHHFGKGLVRTPDDFGTRGQPPTHPELLDYLATKLLEDKWSIKKLHKQIMLSDVYQQSSLENPQARIADPDNRLLWRMPRRHLELEAMRDAMLATSGELDTKMGGRPFELLKKPAIPRRSVYAFVNRDIVSPLASTFDAANPNSCTARRPETTVPQQTLFALNSAFIQDRAVAMAARKEVASAEKDSDKVKALYRLAFSRLPDEEEEATALKYVQSQPAEGKEQTWQRLAHALLAANEFVFVD